MAIRSNNVYLNTLCLAAWAPGDTTMRLAKAAVKMYDSTSPDERTMITPLNVLYVKLLKQVIDGKLDLSNRSEAHNVILQYQDDPVFSNNKVSLEEFRDMLIPETIPSQTKIKQIVKKVGNFLVFNANSRKLRMMLIANQRASMEDDEDKQNDMLQKILDDASEFSEIYNSQNILEDGPIEEIDFDDPQSMDRALKQQHKKRDGELIKFGWQGLNEMFGPRKAACYGEMLAFAGCSHCGKSLILQQMAMSHAVYNKPPDCGGLKPLILFISLENEAHENMRQFYKTLYVNRFHKEPEGMSDEDIVTFLSNTLNKTGFHFRIVRRMGESFGYSDYVALVDSFLKKGFKVVATYLDYITLCRHEVDDLQKNDAKQIELMVKRFTDHSNSNAIFFCTAFQLDAEAARIKQSGQTNAVRRFNEATLSDCKGAIKPLDLLFFNDIENNAKGVSYLCMAWRKHRYVEDTPKEWKYCAYRFGPLGILDDINGESQCVRDIYADDEDNPDGPEQQVSIF